MLRIVLSQSRIVKALMILSKKNCPNTYAKPAICISPTHDSITRVPHIHPITTLFPISMPHVPFLLPHFPPIDPALPPYQSIPPPSLPSKTALAASFSPSPPSK